jgi:hypothetical protein
MEREFFSDEMNGGLQSIIRYLVWEGSFDLRVLHLYDLVWIRLSLNSCLEFRQVRDHQVCAVLAC